MNPSNDIVIFGGSFDPPHQGHLDCIELASAYLPEAKIWVLPAGQVASAKNSKTKTADHSFEERFALCQQSLASSKLSDKIIVSDYEKKLAAKLRTDRVYSLQTIEAIHEDNPKAKIYFLIGQDQLASFSRWHKPLEILGLASLIAVERPNGTSPEKTLQDLADQLNVKITSFNKNQSFKIQGHSGTITLLSNKNLAASSTIKEMLTQNQPIPAGWLNTQIQQELSNHQLYKTREEQ